MEVHRPLITKVRRPLLSAALAALMMLTGCTSDSRARPEKRGPISFVDGKDSSQGAQIRQRVAAWNRLHPREHVTMVELAESTDDQRAQVVAHAQDAAGSPAGTGCFDVITMDVIWTAEFARRGYLVPLDPGDFHTKEFLTRPIESARDRGKLWGIPLRSDVALLFYRKDILDAEGLQAPRSWDELRQQAITLGPKYKIGGFAAQFGQYEGFTVNVLESIWSAGGELIDRKGRIVVGSRESKAGITRLVQGFQEKWILPEATGYQEERSRIAFQDQKALFLRNWTYVHRLLGDDGSPVAHKFGVVPLPWPSAMGGWNLALSACAKNRDTAQDFMRFLTSESSQRTLFREAAFSPSRRSLYADAALVAEYPYLRYIKESIDKARNRPVTPYYGDVTGAVQTRLHGALNSPEMLDVSVNNLEGDLLAARR